jgi:hypothetical protein
MTFSFFANIGLSQEASPESKALEQTNLSQGKILAWKLTRFGFCI